MSALLSAAPPPAAPDAPDVPKGFEYVGGALQELPVSYLSSYVAGRVFRYLDRFTEERGLGWVCPEGTSFRCFPHAPEQVRRADAAFHRLDRLTAEQAFAAGHLDVAPDLVVEVISPNDLARDVNAKRLDWLRAGAQLVWVVDPETRTLLAFQADGPSTEFGPDDDLTAEPLLPGFRVPMAELFRPPAAPPT